MKFDHFDFLSETRWVRIAQWGCFGDAITYFNGNTKIALEYSGSKYFPQKSAIMQFDTTLTDLSQSHR